MRDVVRSVIKMSSVRVFRHESKEYLPKHVGVDSVAVSEPQMTSIAETTGAVSVECNAASGTKVANT